jgi:hypothetical protein
MSRPALMRAVGVDVGIAWNLAAHRSMSGQPIQPITPTKHPVLSEDEV